MVPWKGLEYGIKAIKHIEGKYLIFGEGPDKERLKEMARKEGVWDKVLFFGKIPHEKVQLYLRCCDVLLVPSTYEPFGIVILDGFAAGVPVVASNVGGIPELLREEQMFECYNVDEIVDRIHYCLEHRDKIARIQTKKLEEYKWSRIAKKLLQIYEEFLGWRA